MLTQLFVSFKLVFFVFQLFAACHRMSDPAGAASSAGTTTPPCVNVYRSPTAGVEGTTTNSWHKKIVIPCARACLRETAAPEWSRPQAYRSASRPPHAARWCPEKLDPADRRETLTQRKIWTTREEVRIVLLPRWIWCGVVLPCFCFRVYWRTVS